MTGVTALAGGSPHRFSAVRPSRDELANWVRQELTDDQIADIIAERAGGDRPSKQAVALWRKAAGVKRHKRRPNLDHTAVRPWTVRLEHTGDAIEHRLYDYSRRNQGRKLSPQENRRLDKFLAILEEHQLVVDYDPDTERGWCFRPRDRKLDDPDSIIRKPVE
jgi:hypothetical protein